MLNDTFANLTDFMSRRGTYDDGSGAELMKVFIGLQLFGLFGILITLMTVIFSHSTPRHAAWYSFAISWLISTVAYTLLFWGGYLFGGLDPPPTLCLMQGVMIYASPPLTSFTTFSLVVQIWYLVRSVKVSSSQTEGVQGRPSQMTLILLLVLPYLLFVAILVGNFILGINNPSIVKRFHTNKPYCSFSNKISGRISTALCAVFLIPVAILEVFISRALRQQWLFKQAPHSRSMVCRVALFTLMGLTALTFSLFFFFSRHHRDCLDIVLSLLPVLVVLVFGTQNDVLRVWMFWRKTKPAETVDDDDKIEPSTKIYSPPTIVIRAGSEA